MEIRRQQSFEGAERGVGAGEHAERGGGGGGGRSGGRREEIRDADGGVVGGSEGVHSGAVLAGSDGGRLPAMSEGYDGDYADVLPGKRRRNGYESELQFDVRITIVLQRSDGCEKASSSTFVY